MGGRGAKLVLCRESGACASEERYSQGSGFGQGMGTSYWSVVGYVDDVLLRRILCILSHFNLSCLFRTLLCASCRSNKSLTDKSLKVSALKAYFVNDMHPKVLDLKKLFCY